METTIFYYRQGMPIETGAIIELEDSIKRSPKRLEELSAFDAVIEVETTRLIYHFEKSDMVLGFGETMKGLDKRGSKLVSFCSDEPNHLPSKESLYGAHNFFVILGEKTRGYFIDFPGEILFDVGFEDKNIFNMVIQGVDFDIYEIQGDSLKAVVHKFLSLIGEGYVPPKWGFGYQQCRWSYETADDIRRVAKAMRAADIPCDAIYLDIDYMERFKDFTICDEKFPTFENFVRELRDLDFKLVPIIDAGVKIESGYDVYEEGIRGNHFCVDEKGLPFVAAVWPGLVHFPDFLNDDTRQWFGDKYEVLTRHGIEGFWNDMNEPAIFYTPERLKAFYAHVEKSKEKALDIYSFFELTGEVRGLANSMADYKSFYHRVGDTLVRHDKVHNLYGYNMTRSAYQGLEKIDPDKRFLLFSRASYIGMHRYGGIWMGDNGSWWEHVELTMKMLPALNMCGFMYAGADTGGFQHDADSELMIRWNQLSIFTPLYRNHAAMGTRDQEPYAFDEETTATLRNVIGLRYALIPYLYSSYMKAVKKRVPYSANLIMAYDKDVRVREIEDQLLIGDSLMIAPIYKQNRSGRMVYLPEDMLLWTSSSKEVSNLRVVKQGDRYIDVALEEIALFIRPNQALALGAVADTVGAINAETMTVVGFLCDGIEMSLYDDDGSTKAYKHEQGFDTKIWIKKHGDDIVARMAFCEHHGLMQVKIIVMDGNGVRYEGAVTRETPSISLEKVSWNGK
ncbi:MAG: alpha-glucosidase [Clostridia bacterium]|nr:alpha-glucosidase [Clostridia bacterium]